MLASVGIPLQPADYAVIAATTCIDQSAVIAGLVALDNDNINVFVVLPIRDAVTLGAVLRGLGCEERRVDWVFLLDHKQSCLRSAGRGQVVRGSVPTNDVGGVAEAAREQVATRAGGNVRLALLGSCFASHRLRWHRARRDFPGDRPRRERAGWAKARQLPTRQRRQPSRRCRLVAKRRRD